MIRPAWASNPESPITVARQRVLRRYQQCHWGRLIQLGEIHQKYPTKFVEQHELLDFIWKGMIFRKHPKNYITVLPGNADGLFWNGVQTSKKQHAVLLHRQQSSLIYVNVSVITTLLPPPTRQRLCDRSFCLSRCHSVSTITEKVTSRFYWNLILWLGPPIGKTD